METILLCDNDKKTIRSLTRNLENSGFHVFIAKDGKEILKYLENYKINLIIMEMELEDFNGIELLEKIREVNEIPVIFATGRENELDRIRGLNAGADDYVCKPFSYSEMTARAKSHLRRYDILQKMGVAINHKYCVGELMIDDEKRVVTVNKKEVKLTPIEYKILLLLVKQHGKVFSISQIYETIWNMKAIGADNTIAVHIRHIREKIEADPRKPQYLKVVWGTGYKVG